MEQASMDVAYVAQLAKLELTAEETASFNVDLNKILAFVGQLEQWDVEGVEPMTHPMPLCDAMREDTAAQSLSTEIALSNAPAQDENQILVPKVVESAH